MKREINIRHCGAGVLFTIHFYGDKLTASQIKIIADKIRLQFPFSVEATIYNEIFQLNVIVGETNNYYDILISWVKELLIRGYNVSITDSSSQIY